MLRKSAAHQKKVDSAVRVLQTTTGVKVPWAMILAGFSKSDSADKIMHQQAQRRLALMGGVDNNQREVVFVNVDNVPSLSDFMKKSIFASMKKITQLLLAIILLAIRRLPPPPPLPPSPSTAISSCLHHSPLSRLASSTDRSRPLSSPPPPSLVGSCRPSPSS